MVLPKIRAVPAAVDDDGNMGGKISTFEHGLWDVFGMTAWTVMAWVSYNR